MKTKSFSFRFDIDSLADIEVGVPRLIEMAKELDMRFTFFVNMGKSFKLGTIIRRQKTGGRGQELHCQTSVLGYGTAIRKLGILRTIRTVSINPNIGLSHKKILFKLLDDGHELGLHGGMDHPLWQWELNKLSKVEINDLMKPAYDHFFNLFGKPEGFASPGFRYNRYVLELMDEYGFKYASDMEGDTLFRLEGFKHMQIPVNIKGPCTKPMIEYLYSSGASNAEIVDKCREEVLKRDLAVIYGHPAFEGNCKILSQLLTCIKEEGYCVVPMKELLCESV